MKIININLKEKSIVFIPETIEDLWSIKQISMCKDLISGLTFRRQKQEDTSNSVRKPVFVTLEIEKYDFSYELDSLRFTGIVKSSKPEELAPIGDYHTIEVELNKKYTLIKNNLFKYQIELLKKNSGPKNNVLVVALDLDVANIYKLNNLYYKKITSIKSNRSGKQYKSSFNINDYFLEIYNVLDLQNFKQIIVAGPGHAKNNLFKYLKEKSNSFNILKQNIQSISRSSISELFTKPEIVRFFENSIIYNEKKLFDEFLANLGKNNGLISYGLEDVKTSTKMGAVKDILISEDLWREKNKDIDSLIKLAENVNSKIHIIDKDHDISKNLKSFSGCIAILRFKV